MSFAKTLEAFIILLTGLQFLLDSLNKISEQIVNGNLKFKKIVLCKTDKTDPKFVKFWAFSKVYIVVASKTYRI